MLCFLLFVLDWNCFSTDLYSSELFVQPPPRVFRLERYIGTAAATKSVMPKSGLWAIQPIAMVTKAKDVASVRLAKVKPRPTTSRTMGSQETVDENMECWLATCVVGRSPTQVHSRSHNSLGFPNRRSGAALPTYSGLTSKHPDVSTRIVGRRGNWGGRINDGGGGGGGDKGEGGKTALSPFSSLD